MQGIEEGFKEAVIEICRELESFSSVKREQEVIKRIFQRFFKELLEIRNLMADIKIQYTGWKIKGGNFPGSRIFFYRERQYERKSEIIRNSIHEAPHPT